MPRRDARSWVATFNKAAPHLSYLCPGAIEPEVIPLHAEPCEEHGGTCVRVTYGALRSHFLWAEEDPLLLMHRLVESLMPSPARSAEERPPPPAEQASGSPPSEEGTSAAFQRRPRASAARRQSQQE